MPITLHAPHSNAGSKEKLDIYCVHVKERADSVPAGEEPVEWRLLTSHEVTSLAQASCNVSTGIDVVGSSRNFSD